MENVLDRINLLDEYQDIVNAWENPTIEPPSFDQWLYLNQLIRSNRKLYTENEADMVHLKTIETLIFSLKKCNLSLVRKLNKETLNGDESMNLAIEIAKELSLDNRCIGRLFDLFEYYVIDSEHAIDWRHFGLLPDAQRAMKSILDLVLDRLDDAYTKSLITRERAIGIAEGATAIMVQSGACDPDYAKEVLKRVKNITPISTRWKLKMFLRILPHRSTV